MISIFEEKYIERRNRLKADVAYASAEVERGSNNWKRGLHHERIKAQIKVLPR